MFRLGSQWMMACLVGVTLLGCQSGGDSSGPSNLTAASNKVDLAKISELQGNWRSECFDSSEFRNPMSTLVIFSIKGSEIETRTSKWSNSQCSGPTEVMERRVFQVSDAGTALNFGKSIDLKLVSRVVFLNTSNVVEKYSRTGVCNTTKWKIGQNETTKLNCEGETEGSMFYSAFHVENDLLFLADSDEAADGSTAETRADAFSGFYFTKIR